MKEGAPRESFKEMIREKCQQAHGCTLEKYIADILREDKGAALAAELS